MEQDLAQERENHVMPESDPTLSQPTPGWFTDEAMEQVIQYDTPAVRSCLRAKQHTLQFERRCFDLNREGDRQAKFEMYSRMEIHMPFLDSDQVPF